MKHYLYVAVAWLTMLGLLLLPGCSLKTPGELNAGNSVTVSTLEDGTEVVTYNGSTYTSHAIRVAQEACLADRAADREAKWKEIGELEGLMKAMAVMHSDTMDMIVDTFGQDPCAPGTNEFDAQIAYYKEQGALSRSIVNVTGSTLKTVAIWGFGAYAVGEVVDGMGNHETVGGDKTSISSGADTKINESTFSHERAATETHSTQSQSQITGAGDNRVEPATNSVDQSDNSVTNPLPEEVIE